MFICEPSTLMTSTQRVHDASRSWYDRTSNTPSQQAFRELIGRGLSLEDVLRELSSNSLEAMRSLLRSRFGELQFSFEEPRSLSWRDPVLPANGVIDDDTTLTVSKTIRFPHPWQWSTRDGVVTVDAMTFDYVFSGLNDGQDVALVSSSWSDACDGRIYDDDHHQIGSVTISPANTPVWVYDQFTMMEVDMTPTVHQIHRMLQGGYDA